MKMKPEYERWIREHVYECEGNCKYYSYEMATAFPELKVTSGRYFRTEDSPAEHWWCVTENGEIIDPTASQFELDRDGRVVYKVDLANYVTDENISGKCPLCGAWCYEGDEYCSAKCELEALRKV
jgi:hypothetical protein